MPRTCTVCSHKSRLKIDKAIVFGRTNRAIASQFRLTRSSVQRHKQHVAAAIERATKKRELSIGEDILHRLEDLYGHGSRLLSKAETAKNLPASIAALRELRGILGAVYEVAREAVPKSSATVPSEEYIKAINHALGISGEFIPLDDRTPEEKAADAQKEKAGAAKPLSASTSKLLPERTSGGNSVDLSKLDSDDELPILP